MSGDGTIIPGEITRTVVMIEDNDSKSYTSKSLKKISANKIKSSKKC